MFNYLCSPMELHPIEAGNFKLDGGAMFGVVPKVIYGLKQTPLTLTI